MKDRIQQFIDFKGISPGDLSTVLDVQRSNISHILNGRNKPGAAFIEKFLLAYPDLNARWLLTGQGGMLNKDTHSIVDNSIKESQSKEKLQTKSVKQSSGPSDSNKIIDKEETKSKLISSKEEEGNITEKLVLLNSDGTFTIYRQKM